MHATSPSVTLYNRKYWSLLASFLLLLHAHLCHAFRAATSSTFQGTPSEQYVILRASQGAGNISGDSSRRQFFQKTTAGLATASTLLLIGAPQTANADPSLVSSLQGPLQDAIAPGHWIGQFIGINSKQVTWDFSDTTPERVSAALVDVLNNLNRDERARLLIPEFTIAKADASKVHVRTWTKNEWLDSLDVTFRASGGSGCKAQASFYATGFLPTSVPGAPLANIAVAWFPFASPGPRGQMLQDYRLNRLEGLVRDRLSA